MKTIEEINKKIEETIENKCLEAVGENGKGIYDLAELRDALSELYTQQILSLIEELEGKIKINRVWAMPSAWTFTIKPIKQLLEREVGSPMFQNGLWCDPFAGMNSPAQVRNDLNPKANAEFHLDAIEFLKKQPDNKYDGVLLDPPYSLRQVSEHYKEAGIKVTGWHTSSGWSSTIKNEIARITKSNGKVICFGWNSMGMGLKRGFEMTEILLVAHGGNKNDTIVTVEVKKSLTK